MTVPEANIPMMMMDFLTEHRSGGQPSPGLRMAHLFKPWFSQCLFPLPPSPRREGGNTHNFKLLSPIIDTVIFFTVFYIIQLHILH